VKNYKLKKKKFCKPLIEFKLLLGVFRCS